MANNDNMDKYQNKYRIPSARLAGYDYGSNSMYYVTICTKNRIHYFGEIITPVRTDNHPVETDNYPSLQKIRPSTSELQPTIIGNIANQYWTEIPKHYPFVELDQFIIMPNHIHGILFFNKPGYDEWKPNQFGVQSKNLSAVIRGFKSTAKRFANDNAIEFEWQSRFHDHIIRDEQSLDTIRQYIIDNPANWEGDEFNKP